jgi:hypothetical protein
LGIRLKLILVLYLEDLANPNNGLNLVPTTPSAKTSGCEKTTLNLGSIRRATKEKTQIRDSQEADFNFFTD